MTKASCKECPSSFELVPPADTDYSIPRERHQTENYIERIYECVDEGHRNTIYWEKEEDGIMSTKKHTIEDLKHSKLDPSLRSSG
jgi:hypothetical protein